MTDFLTEKVKTKVTGTPVGAGFCNFSCAYLLSRVSFSRKSQRGPLILCVFFLPIFAKNKQEFSGLWLRGSWFCAYARAFGARIFVKSQRKVNHFCQLFDRCAATPG